MPADVKELVAELREGAAPFSKGIQTEALGEAADLIEQQARDLDAHDKARTCVVCNGYICPPMTCTGCQLYHGEATAITDHALRVECDKLRTDLDAARADAHKASATLWDAASSVLLTMTDCREDAGLGVVPEVLVAMEQLRRERDAARAEVAALRLNVEEARQQRDVALAVEAELRGKLEAAERNEREMRDEMLSLQQAARGEAALREAAERERDEARASSPHDWPVFTDARPGAMCICTRCGWDSESQQSLLPCSGELAVRERDTLRDYTRDLAARLRAATCELATLHQRAEANRTDLRDVAHALGYCHEAEGHDCHPADRETLLRGVRELQRRADEAEELRQRALPEAAVEPLRRLLALVSSRDAGGWEQTAVTRAASRIRRDAAKVGFVEACLPGDREALDAAADLLAALAPAPAAEEPRKPAPPMRGIVFAEPVAGGYLVTLECGLATRLRRGSYACATCAVRPAAEEPQKPAGEEGR